MNTCPPCIGDCNQGRDCPQWDQFRKTKSLTKKVLVKELRDLSAGPSAATKLSAAGTVLKDWRTTSLKTEDEYNG